LLSIIVTTLLLTLVLNVLLKKIKMPPIIGYIFTGTMITYIFNLNDAVNNKDLKEIAEFGIAFLMFTIGLELSVTHLRDIRYQVFILGSLQIILTGVLSFIISYMLLNIDLYSSIVISMVIPLSSTAIVLKSLNETGEINRKYGKNGLGILIMQDIAVIPILLIIWFLSTNLHHSGAQDEGTIFVILKMMLGGALLVGTLVFIGKYLLEPFLNIITETQSDELFVTAILFLAIGSAHLAHIFGFSLSMGAFIAGMLIAETKYKHQVETDLIPFRDILLGIFFITVGMQIKLDIVLQNIYLLLFLIPVIFIIKFAVIYYITGFKNIKRTRLKTAVILVQIGEFALAVLELSTSSEIIKPEYSQLLIIITVLSMILTPMLLTNLSNIVDKFMSHSLESESEEINLGMPPSSVVILGYGEFGQNIAKVLQSHNISYSIIENNIDIYYKGMEHGEHIIFGNASKRNILHLAVLNWEQKVVVAINNPKKLYQVCEMIINIVPIDNIIVKVHSEAEKKEISSLNIINVIVENDITSKAVLELITKDIV